MTGYCHVSYRTVVSLWGQYLNEGAVKTSTLLEKRTAEEKQVPGTLWGTDLSRS
jgi:hypothetical protein